VALAQRPDPAPLETDDVKIVGSLTVLWAAALVVLLVLKAAGTDIHTWWLLMCLEGALLGAVGVRYCQRRRAAIARDRAPAPQ
jgi:fatty acid desaturase